MRGVFIEDRIATVARSPYRADVALFVGFVERPRHVVLVGDVPTLAVDAIVPDDDGTGGDPNVYRWLVRNGWARGDKRADRADQLDELLDIPVPIDSPAAFDRLFVGDARPWGPPRRPDDPTSDPIGRCDTYLRAAVRAFFAEGGRLCYVVRVGAPWQVPMTLPEVVAAATQQDRRIARLLPGFAGLGVVGSPVDRATWKGVWTAYGLPDVSFVAVPDLPDIVRAPLPDVLPPDPPAPIAEFYECSNAPAELPDNVIAELRGPMIDELGMAKWATAIDLLVGEIEVPRAAGGLREVQAVLAIPRTVEHRTPPLEILDRAPKSRFLVLAYPWLRTQTSTVVAEGLAPPDGTLVGVLARNALERGTYRSVGGRRTNDVLAVAPPVSDHDVEDPSDPTTLVGRTTLIGPTAGGVQILSDVTTEPTDPFRLGHVSRLVASIERALRTIGETIVFESNNEETWASLRARVRDVMREFWRAGALRGESEGDAFGVRCDRATMTQDDLDNGRMVAEVDFAVTTSIQRINVVLTRTGDSVAVGRAA